VRPLWKENPSPAYQAVKALILGGFGLLIVVPIMVVVSTSLASDEDIIDAGGYVLWPSHPTLKAYGTLFSCISTTPRSGRCR
jgi:ABC-type glycerol-3-phosphate transport system permease component